MRGLRKEWLILVVISLLLLSLHTAGWAEGKWEKGDPVSDEWNMMDLLIARPLGIAAGIVGSAAFIVSLPFTIPTRSVDDAAKMFVIEPFKFSFVRKFPDENM